MNRGGPESAPSVSRRGFLALAGAAASVPLLAACSGGAGSGGDLKFWDMPQGQGTAYTSFAQKLTQGYVPPKGLPKASYQVVQWANFYQTFSAAIASDTGPAISNGGGFQAFQFAEQGAIAYADNVVATMKKNGIYDDFLPGTIDAMKTDKGYVAIPWDLDIEPMWYRKSLLDEVGVPVPTDWDSLLAAGKALRKIGVTGLGTGAGPSDFTGSHLMIAMMINNGGGLFDESGKPDCVTPRNIEAMDFIRELVGLHIMDPAAVSYSQENVYTLWKNKKIGLGIGVADLPNEVGDTSGDLMVTSPLTGPHGDKGGLMYINNIMMYKNTPSQAGSEAFLLWWLDQLATLWEHDLVANLPVRKSIINSAHFQANAQQVKIINEWQPICKTDAAVGTKLFGGLAALDGGQAIAQFAQTMLQGNTDSRTALQTLQTGLRSVVG